MNTSAISYDRIKKSGYLSEGQAQYFSVFVSSGKPMTHKEVTMEVDYRFNTKHPERNSRPSELEQMGLIEKRGVRVCRITGHIVTQWAWTGRMVPYRKESRWCPCDHCGGIGRVEKTVYVSDERQLKMF